MTALFSCTHFALTWPEASECLPDVGDEAPPPKGWQVDQRQAFESDRAEALYDRVFIYWCVPIRAESD